MSPFSGIPVKIQIECTPPPDDIPFNRRDGEAGAYHHNPEKDGHKFERNCPTLLKVSTSVPDKLNEVISMPSTSSDINGISAKVNHRGAYIIRKNTFDVSGGSLC